MSSIDTSIFKDYDIRGIYPTQVNEETYYRIGRALVLYLKVDTIAVGHDTRLSSPSLFESLTKGIMDQGAHVINLGNISTEIHSFASGFYQFPANVVVSASHNPAEYNGIKMLTKGVIAIHGEHGMPEIKDLAVKGEFPEPEKKGTMESKDILADWVKHVMSFIDVQALRPVRVLIDAGNGMGGLTWKELIGKTPIEILPLYFEPDGHFPHHLPDPLTPGNMDDAMREVFKQKADIGFAIDGDADRLFAVDEKGNSISGTILTAMLAAHLLKKHGPAPILYNVVCGRIVPETIQKYNGTPHRVRVGHSFIKQYMRDKGALFAGEHSGHFYFRDNFTADTSTITGLLLLECIAQDGRPVSEIVKEYDKYPSSGERNYKVGNILEVTTAIEEEFKNAQTIDHLDGLSVWYPDWWFNLRGSKTEPLLRLNMEADNRQILDEKLKQVESTIIKLGGHKE